MRTPAPLITALALGALVTPALSAQSATDLADVCKTLGNAKVGQWASFEGTSASGGGKLRLAVVGSERAADSTFYWFEVNFAGQEPGKSGVVQILAPNLASGSAAPRSLIVKLGPQPAMRISGQMAAMMGQNPGKDNSAFLAFSSRWISTAHRTASTALANSASRLSPGESTTRPWCCTMKVAKTVR